MECPIFELCECDTAKTLVRTRLISCEDEPASTMYDRQDLKRARKPVGRVFRKVPDDSQVAMPPLNLSRFSLKLDRRQVRLVLPNPFLAGISRTADAVQLKKNVQLPKLRTRNAEQVTFAANENFVINGCGGCIHGFADGIGSDHFKCIRIFDDNCCAVATRQENVPASCDR